MWQRSTYIYRKKVNKTDSATDIKQTVQLTRYTWNKYISYLLKHASIFQPIGQIVQFIALQSILLIQHSPYQADDRLMDSTCNDLTSYK